MYQRVCAIALRLPGVEESTAYGTPSLKVKGRIMCRLRTEAEGALALRCDFLDRQILGILAQPIKGDLGLSDTTVKSHVAHILDALVVSNRTEAVYALARAGLSLRDLETAPPAY
jgi:hypothetical protein